MIELPQNKIVTVESFNSGYDRSRKLVFTNGCFDILHRGHIEYLYQARNLGDALMVGVNTDNSVKRLKGEMRPINGEYDRMMLLASLYFVDYVVLFDEDTPLQLIKSVRPDILVKGGDYTRDTIVGADFVESTGGEVVVISFVEGYSTTKVINKMR